MPSLPRRTFCAAALPQLGEVAEANDLWLHVDACVGGYFAPFARMNGVELQEELSRRGGHMPTVVITAHPDQPLARKARRAGAYAVLAKPFRDEDLRVSVEGALHA